MVHGNVFVLDNGAYTAKAGFSTSNEPRVIPNCIMKAKSERRRPFVSGQVEECRDASGLFYILPFQKGYLVNWDVQKNVWDYLFSSECLPVNFSETPFIVTEPYFNFNSVQDAMMEIFFEEYECHSLLRINGHPKSPDAVVRKLSELGERHRLLVPSGDLCYRHYQQEHPDALCCLLVDVGYSFTHVVPYIRSRKLKSGIRRIDIGGKVLTNHLKEIISYRQLHVMDETYVMNQAKEDACFVSLDFYKDMEKARKRDASNTIVRDYVLPDYTTLRRGYVREPGAPAPPEEAELQTLRLNNERFTVPELLFNPSDVGITQMGVDEAIVDSIAACLPEARPHLYRNILLVGGSALFPGFRERVYKEVRALAPAEFDIKVSLARNPVTYAWHGGRVLAHSAQLSSMLVLREEYEEEGNAACTNRFDV